MPPKKVNLAELNRDELIAVVHKINGQLQAAQQNSGDAKLKASMDRAMVAVEGERDEYMMRLQSATEQISLLKDELTNRGEEVAALSSQLSLLSDQLVEATTISSSLQNQTAPQPQVAAVVTAAAETPTPAQEREVPQQSMKTANKGGGGGPSMEEYDSLQNKIVDLQETLDYYAAIVQAQDGSGGGGPQYRGKEDVTTTTVVDQSIHQEVLDEMEELKYQLESTDGRLQITRKDLLRSNEACATLTTEVELLTQQVRDMDCALRCVEAAAIVLADNNNTAAPPLAQPHQQAGTAAAGTPSSSGHPLVAQPSATTGRVAAKIVFDGNVRSPRGVPESTRGRRGSTVQGGLPLLDFAALPDRNVRNPNLRERKLLDRLDAVERYAHSLADYDISRQRSYDELERNRADLFAYLNESNQAQHEKIQSLQKSVGSRDKRIAELESRIAKNAEAVNEFTNPHREDVASSSSCPPPKMQPTITTLSQHQQTTPQWGAASSTTSSTTQFPEAQEMRMQIDLVGLPTDASAQAHLIAKIQALERRELMSEAVLKMLRAYHESVLVTSAEYCGLIIEQSLLMTKELTEYRDVTASCVDASEVKVARHSLLKRLSMRLRSHPANPRTTSEFDSRSRSSLDSFLTGDTATEDRMVVGNDSYANMSNPTMTLGATRHSSSSRMETPTAASPATNNIDTTDDHFPVEKVYSAAPSSCDERNQHTIVDDVPAATFEPLSEAEEVLPSSVEPMMMDQEDGYVLLQHQPAATIAATDEDGWGDFDQGASTQSDAHNNNNNTATTSYAARVDDFDPFA